MNFADTRSIEQEHQPYTPVDFSKIKVGIKQLDDAVYVLGDYKKANPSLANKETVLRAINNSDYEKQREISNYFFKTSGIYSRLCRYMAYLYKYDWYVTPYIINSKSGKAVNTENIKSSFNNVLAFLDDFEVKKYFGEVALKVIKDGCYYGYIIRENDKVAVQELPVKYCRSRYSVAGHPAVEFNMKYFNDNFSDVSYRMRILNLFPDDFKKGYNLYLQGKLTGDFAGDTSGWYLLDPNSAIKFNMNGEDYPMMISVIPAIIELNEAQDLDRKKMQQELLKIIIQKMPVDKNGDLIFDIDEAQQLHNNAVKMLGKAIGIDVLTTFADVDVEDMADTTTTSATDELERVERAVYNEAGVSQMQFNTDGNIALEKSILNDAASMRNLLSQFECFLNVLIAPFNKNKKLQFKVQVLETTIYNYQDIAKLYKDQTSMGYSKMLPQVALGLSQSSILANAYFENDVLDLVNVFIPPLMSSTMNADILNRNSNKSSGDNENVGRPEKSDDEKSEKTMKNIESNS